MTKLAALLAPHLLTLSPGPGHAGKEDHLFLSDICPQPLAGILGRALPPPTLSGMSLPPLSSEAEETGWVSEREAESVRKRHLPAPTSLRSL